MKKSQKLFNILMAATMLMSTGCGVAGGGNVADSTTDIQIAVWKNGSMNETTMGKLVANFEAKYPQYNIILDYSGVDNLFGSNIELGPKYNSYDLFFGSMPDQSVYKYLEPLNSILTDNNNEAKDKFDEYILSNILAKDNNYYYLPYVNNWLGLVYNANIIDGTTYTAPRTTDELTVLVAMLQNQNITPFIHFKTEGYWEYISLLWEIQYDGLDYYTNTLLQVGDPTGKNPNKEVLLAKDGRYQVMKVLDNIINSNTVYSGSNTQDFTDAQTKFFAGRAAMMANGTWLVNEMGKTAKDSNMKMMKIPVISSITDRTEAIEDDEELAALIDAIDAVGLDKASVALTGDGYSVTQGDIDIVFEARNYISSIANDNVVCIPNYATGKEGAKEFVKYLFSEKQIETYAQATHLPLPYKAEITKDLDTSDWNAWEKDLLVMQSNSIPVIFRAFDRHPLFTSGGVGNPYVNVSVVSSMAVPSGRLSAEDLWATLQNNVNNGWKTWMLNLGIN